MMADGAIWTYDQGKAHVGVEKSAPSCMVRAPINLAAQNGAKPDRDVHFQPDLADYMRVWRTPELGIFWYNGRGAIERVKRHPGASKFVEIDIEDCHLQSKTRGLGIVRRDHPQKIAAIAQFN